MWETTRSLEPPINMPSKSYNKSLELVDKKTTYAVADAIALAKKTARAKFDEALELHVRLGIDPSKGEQQVRGTISFPHGVGKTKRVAAFVEAEKEAEAKEAGADIVGGEELITKLAQKGAIEFDVAVATPKIMPKLSKLAKLLGPRGLMPNPKTDTLGTNVKKMVSEQKAGKESFKNDKTANIHQIFGRASFEDAQLIENLNVLVETIKKLKPVSAKGIYIKNASISTTMGPGISIDLS